MCKCTRSIYDGTQYLRLGAWGGGGRYFKGQIDEVAIFNRTLSSNEIQSLYLADSSSLCAALPSPVVSSVSATAGFAGNLVIIQGTNLLTVSRVLFNGVATTYSFLPNGSIIATVPANVASGPITLVTPTGSFTALNFFTAIPPQCLSSPSGLISWWPGEGNAFDLAGTNNGTNVNNVTYSAGKTGQAFTFAGNNNYIQISDSTNLRPPSVTLACWFNSSNTSGNIIFKACWL